MQIVKYVGIFFEYIEYAIGAILLFSLLYNVYAYIKNKDSEDSFMSTRQVALICVSIIFGLIVHGIITKPIARYTFYAGLANPQTGYIFDAYTGTLKIFPASFGMDGFVPYTTIEGREANTWYKPGRNTRLDAFQKRTQESEKRPDESDEEYAQRLTKLWEDLP